MRGRNASSALSVCTAWISSLMSFIPPPEQWRARIIETLGAPRRTACPRGRAAGQGAALICQYRSD